MIQPKTEFEHTTIVMGTRFRTIVSISPDGRTLFEQMSRQSEQEYSRLRSDLGAPKYDALMAELEDAVARLSSRAQD